VTDELPPAEPTSSPAHRAPAYDRRPRSALAIWSLAATLVIGVGASLAGLFWLALVPAAALAVVALVRIKPQQAKGQGMAIVALVLALLIGSCQYVGAKSMRDIAEHLGSGALAALASDDPEMIGKWVAPEAEEKGAKDRIRQRYAAVVEELGPFQQEVVVGALWLGVGPIVAPPTDVEEIGAGIGEAWSLRPGAFWVKARFRDGVVHVELLVGDGDAERLTQALEDASSKKPSRVLTDLRFFRDK